MFCTCCHIEISSDDHYSTEIHEINSIRKIKELNPLEFIEDICDSITNVKTVKPSNLSDFCLSDCTKKSIDNPICRDIAENECLFCEKTESLEHYYYDHKMSETEISYIKSLVCSTCKEGFINKKEYKIHLDSGKHQECYFDGTRLLCKSGKVLSMNKMKLGQFPIEKKTNKVKNEKGERKIFQKRSFRGSKIINK